MAGWRLGLAVSVLVNLFLVAVIAGHLIGIGAYRGEGALIARALSNAQHSLSASDAAAFRAVMLREAPQFAASARALGASREVLAARITAPVFDRAAVAAAFGQWRGDWMRFTGDFSGPLLDALGTLSPEGRRKLLEERRRAGSDTSGISSRR
jgi:uncharacterized membrane protein